MFINRPSELSSGIVRFKYHIFSEKSYIILMSGKIFIKSVCSPATLRESRDLTSFWLMIKRTKFAGRRLERFGYIRCSMFGFGGLSSRWIKMFGINKPNASHSDEFRLPIFSSKINFMSTKQVFIFQIAYFTYFDTNIKTNEKPMKNQWTPMKINI